MESLLNCIGKGDYKGFVELWPEHHGKLSRKDKQKVAKRLLIAIIQDAVFPESRKSLLLFLVQGGK